MGTEGYDDLFINEAKNSLENYCYGSLFVTD